MIMQCVMVVLIVCEVQKGVFVVVVICLFIVLVIIVIFGICVYKFYGDIGDVVYGQFVGDLLFEWFFGVFVVMIVVVVLISFNSVFNLFVVFYVCDLYEIYIDDLFNVW